MLPTSPVDPRPTRVEECHYTTTWGSGGAVMAVTCAGVAVAAGRKAALANWRSSVESTGPELETIAPAVLSHPSALTRQYHHHACASSCPDAGPASVRGAVPACHIYPPVAAVAVANQARRLAFDDDLGN